jgi:hypothetical protein
LIICRGYPASSARAARHEPRLHILINNAGANETGTLETVAVSDWDEVLDVNLRAGFFLTQQLLPQLRAAATPHDPARIINIGSIGGLHVPHRDTFPYGASKAACRPASPCAGRASPTTSRVWSCSSCGHPRHAGPRDSRPPRGHGAPGAVRGFRMANTRPSRLDTAWLSSPPALNVWAACADLGVPMAVIVFHNQLGYVLPLLRLIATMYPTLPILIDHLGTPHPRAGWGYLSSSFGLVIGVSPSKRCSNRRYVQSQRPSAARW